MTSPNAPATPAGGQSVVGAKAGGATLSRELADFLVELSIALHKHAIYPPAHPLLAAAIDGATRRLWGLLADRQALSIGVARRQLIIEGVATDPNHPLLQELAQRLHRHHLGAVKFLAGVTRDEMGDLLATLGVDAARVETPLGLDPELTGERWEHARLFPLTYEKLELLDEDPEAPDDGRMRGGRAAQLWVGLARAALASDATADDAESLEPVVVARAIDEHQREQAYDQVIVGYLLQIATELRSAQGAEASALQRRIARLVGALNEDTLARLLEMGGDVRQRRKFLADAASGMSVEAVVDLVKAAADAERQTISHSMVRLLTKLAQHADGGTERRRVEADQSLRESVLRLISDWSLDDPNPYGYRAVLESIARAAPNEDHGAVPTEVEPERLIAMGLEVGVLGAPVWRSVDRLYGEGAVVRLLDLLEGAPEPAIADALWRNLSERGALHDLLDAERPEMAVVERFVRREGLAAATPLLDALDHHEDAKVRERLLDLLASLGADVGAFVVRRLPLARVQVLRELIALLARLEPMPAEFAPHEYLDHSDTLVRREVIRILLRDEGERDAAIVAALGDADQRIVYLGLQAAQDGCPRAAAEVARHRVEAGEFDAPLRALAVRVAGSIREPATLEWLTSRATARTRWLRRRVILPSSPEVVAAVSAIALGWREDRAAAGVLQLAKKSKDADVQQAAIAPRQTAAVRITDPRGMEAIPR